VNVKLVLVGVTDNINDLMGEHASIGRCVEQIPMPRMNITERREILEKIVPRLGMKIHDDALWKIVRLSRDCQHMCILLGFTPARARSFAAR